MFPVSQLNHLCVIRAKTVTDNTIIENKIREFVYLRCEKKISDVYNRVQITATVFEHKHLRY